MFRFGIRVTILLTLIISLSCFAVNSNSAQATRNILTETVTPKVLDELWSAYYTTNNPIYIKRILTFVNQDNTLLLFGYEITNRNYICQITQRMKFNNEIQRRELLAHVCGKHAIDDLVAALKRRYPEHYKKKFDQAITVSAAIWSLGGNQRKNKVVAQQIKEMIAADPTLDYSKKIKASME